jgi:3-hydroxyisobutyrate dehydrogenase-like beta-hydroxyacid dehydrogenase
VSKTPATVGVIGLGLMGSRIARRLIAGAHAVRVWDRSEEAVDELVADGAIATSSPAELAAAVDVAFSVLANDEAVRDVIIGGGVLSSLRSGGVYADLSTTSVDLVMELAAAAREAGADLIDIEMSGSTPQVESGQLTLLVGGDAALIDRIRPVLDEIAATILHVGALGAGAKMKLVVNIMLGVGMEALAEAITFGEAVGLDRERLLDALEHTAVVAPAHKPKLANVRRNDYPVAFPLRLMHKDFGLVLGHARDAGIDLPATRASAEVCGDELAASGDDVDFSAIVRRIESQLAARAHST